jgi:hypothetical protein
MGHFCQAVLLAAEIQHSPAADNRHPRLPEHHFLMAGQARIVHGVLACAVPAGHVR